MSRHFFTLLLVLLLLPLSRAWASDGVIEINAVRAVAGGVTPSDTPGLPVTIDSPGSYILTGNLESTGSNEHIIEITSDHVAVDLNGFTIRCTYFINPCAGTGTGRGIYGPTQNGVTVRNGTVRDMPSDGIYLGSYTTVENVRAIENGGDGVAVSGSSIIRHSIAAQNLGSGFYIWGATIVEHSSSYLNDTGVSFRGNGVLIRDNTIRSNTNAAITAVGGPLYGGYVGNIIVSNNGTSPIVDGDQGIGLTPIGSNFCGIDTTCP